MHRLPHTACRRGRESFGRTAVGLQVAARVAYEAAVPYAARTLRVGLWLAVTVGLTACKQSHGAKATSPAASTEQGGRAKTPDLGAHAVRVSVQTAVRQQAVVVANHSDATVRVARALTIWPATGKHRQKPRCKLTLRATCQSRPPRCIALAPGAAFHALGLEHAVDRATHPCGGCDLSAGRYHYRVQACDIAQSFDSTAFAVPEG